MKQVLHIFGKDVRYLWPIILTVLLLMIAHAVFDVRSLPINAQGINQVNTILTLLNILLPLTIFFLVAQVIFQEPLPGNKQFWLTRPYYRTRLLAAKLLFVLAFISVPLFLSDCYILAVQGFPVLGAYPDLLLRQLILLFVFVLPSFGIATLTTGVAQFMLAWFVVLLALIFEQIIVAILFHSGNDVGVDLISGSTFVVAFTIIIAGVIVWQYATRRTAIARLFALSVVCAFVPITWGISFLIHSRSRIPEPPPSPNQFGIVITYSSNNATPQSSKQNTSKNNFVQVFLPLRVVGAPPKTLLRGNARIRIISAGKPWPEPNFTWIGELERINNDYWLTLNFDKSRFNMLRQQSVNLRASFELQILNDTVETIVPFAESSFRVPDLGFCRIAAQDPEQPQLTCRAGLTHPVEVDVQSDSSRIPGQIIAGFPKSSIPWGLSPASDLGTPNLAEVQPGSQLEFIPRRNIADLRLALDFRDVLLARYIVPR